MLSWLFNFSEFATRDRCGPGWTPSLIFFYQVANLLIAVAYFVIPATLMYFWKQRWMVTPKPWIIVMFASFILLCGMTHVTDILVFYYPAYRAFTALFFVTGVVSVLTAMVLPGVVLSFLRITTTEVEKLSTELTTQAKKSERLEDLLKLMRDQNRIMEDIIHSRGWAKPPED